MIQLSANKRLLLVASVLLLLVPLAACAVTTPEIHAKIVDAETGEPQELVRAIVYAGKTVHTLAGEVEKPLFSKTFYFDAKDGEIVVPSQHFLVLDVLRFKDWKLVIKCPGHKRLLIKGKVLKKQMKGHHEGAIKITVQPYETGIDWETGQGNWEVNEYLSTSEVDNPSNTVLRIKGIMKDYEWLFSNWESIRHQRYGVSKIMREEGLRFYVRDYLRQISGFCSQYVRHTTEQCQSVQADARLVLRNLPPTIRSQAGIEEMESAYGWLNDGGRK